MNACIERFKKRMFVRDLETVSAALAFWAQQRFEYDDWSIDDVKLHIKNAMKIVERD